MWNQTTNLSMYQSSINQSEKLIFMSNPIEGIRKTSDMNFP